MSALSHDRNPFNKTEVYIQCLIKSLISLIKSLIECLIKSIPNVCHDRNPFNKTEV